MENFSAFTKNAKNKKKSSKKGRRWSGHMKEWEMFNFFKGIQKINKGKTMEGAIGQYKPIQDE